MTFKLHKSAKEAIGLRKLNKKCEYPDCKEIATGLVQKKFYCLTHYKIMKIKGTLPPRVLSWTRFKKIRK